MKLETKTAEKKIGSVMVAGGGIAGVQASLDLADSGYYVYLVEKSPAIGGVMSQLDKTFPTNDCSMCILAPKLVDCGRNLNIKLLTDSEIIGLEGKPGKFKVSVHKMPRYIDIAKCTGCGDCAKECPVEMPDEFNMKLTNRKAIYKLYAQAVPGAFAIDKRGTSPCKAGCPVNINVQGYVALIAQGKYKEALDLIRRENPFPAICGRVCHHPCETECLRGEVDEPVAIAALKRFVADYELSRSTEYGAQNTDKPELNGKKVAIIGSGPTGLTAAQDLALSGYQVTVFEKLPVPGGMMRVGIPDYRLPPKIIQAEIDAILNTGVELRLNTAVDSLDSLKSEGFDATLIAVGSHVNKELGVPGEDLDGVLSGVDFLRDVNLGRKVDIGDRVAVVGGGNVAIDTARSIVRLGSGEVTIIYRRSREEMPADPHEIAAAEEEGIKIHFLANPTKIIGRDGQVVGVECIKMELGEPDESGRRRPVPISGSEFMIDVDNIIPAIGQTSDLGLVESSKQIKTTKWRTIEADPETLTTGQEGVFCGGDVVSGPAFVVEAIKAGHVAAESISRYLCGKDLKEGRQRLLAPVVKEVPLDEVERVARQKRAALDPKKRIANFDEVELGLTEEQAKAEAQRCLSCGICSECLQCVIACKAEAIDHSQTEEVMEIEVGGIIMAPGFKPFDPGSYDTYGYKRYPNVVTSMEFERILSASGPTEGHILKPSNKKHPEKIAWLQCVGSRDKTHSNNTYCSAVCCMYAIKEAVIAKEHAGHPLDTAIFYMDMRTYGKEFEKYYNRAKEEHGVRFVRSRIHTINQVGNDGNLRLTFLGEDGQVQKEDFDMVVLSVGLTPGKDVVELAKRLGLELNEHGFCKTDGFEPVTTSKDGIFVCGALQGPKDIPYSVMEASAAACEASTTLSGARGTLTRTKEVPPEINISGLPPRIGVWVCHCGINIGGVVDVPAVRDYAATLPYVEYVETNLYTCSADTQEKIKEAILEKGLNRVVVASCTPRTHEPLFRDTCQEAGLNKYLFEMANIRDQCSWVHQNEPEAATEKARDLVRMAVAKAAKLSPLEEIGLSVNHDALIIGGGVAGMESALALANQGFKVSLVEKSDRLGGQALKLRHNFQGQEVSPYLNTLIENVNNHENIAVYLNTEIESVSGFVGNFKTELRTPNSELRTIEHGVAIIAVGAKAYIPEGEYLYGEDDRVVTSQELDEKLAISYQLSAISSVVFIQCVGSRDNERPYCSKVCCTHSVQTALDLKEQNPKMDIYILYRDIRTYGFNEDMYQQARSKGVVFIRYKEDDKPVVSKNGNGLEVMVTDHILDQKMALKADLVCLATAIIPNPVKDLSQHFKVPINDDGFFLEAHMKLRPVDFATDGVFVAGLAHYPKPLDETIAQAKAAASRAGTVLSKEAITVGGAIAIIDKTKCAGCGLCENVCAYKAIEMDEKGKAEIKEALCKGCGTCVATCRMGATGLSGFSDEQVLAMIEAV